MNLVIWLESLEEQTDNRDANLSTCREEEEIVRRGCFVNMFELYLPSKFPRILLSSTDSWIY